MRLPLLFAVFSAVAAACAQAPVEPHERALWDAYQNLRRNGSFSFEMTGRDVYGNVETPLHALLYFRRASDPRTGTDSLAQVELDVYERDAKGQEYPTLRLVGDGTTLYRYDLARREVSTTVYGFYGDRMPDTYLNDLSNDGPRLRLFTQLRAATPGLESYLVRLLTELRPMGDDFAARFTTWSPGMPGRSFDEVPMPTRALNGAPVEDDTVTDPITGRPYVRGVDRYVFFGYDREAPSRTAAFRLYDADPSDDNELWEVASVNLALRTPGRMVDLTLAANAATPPDWAFRPYVGTQGAAFRTVARGN